MALALDSFDLNISLIGESSAKRTKNIEILAVGGTDAIKRTNAQASAAQIVTYLALAMNLYIASYRLSEVWTESAAVGAALGVPYKEAIITLSLAAGGGKTATFTIPGPHDNIFVGNDPNTQAIDTADTIITNLFGEFVTGGTKFGALSDGEQLPDPAVFVKTRVRSVGSGKIY